jgi:hypothetical protein
MLPVIFGKKWTLRGDLVRSERCLYLQLMSLPNTKIHAICYSDACSGQNRNQFIASCLLHVVINHQLIKVIDHKFLESRHTQMEWTEYTLCDWIRKTEDRDICATTMGNSCWNGKKKRPLH